MSGILVVIDTNVLVSALLTKHSDASTVKVLEALFASEIIPLYNDEIINEYEDVLNRKKFSFSKELVELLIRSIRDNGISTQCYKSNEIFEDPDDLVFYEVCLAKREANSMLVTGNIKHFPKKTFIVTPNELMNILSKSK